MSTGLLDDLAPETASQEPSDGNGTDRKRLLILGGVAAVAVIGAAGYFALSGSSGDADAAAPIPTHHAVASPSVQASKAPSAATSPAAVPSTTTVPTAANSLPVGRDPFKALVVAATATSTPSASASTTPTPGATTDPSTSGGSTSDTNPASQGTPQGTLTLKSLDAKPGASSVTVVWDGKTYTVPDGGQFAGYFTYDSEAFGVAMFHAGSQSFTLKAGDSKTF